MKDKSPTGQPNLQSLSLAWLKEEDWPRWLSIDSDFQPDYQHWLRRMNAAIAHYQSLGKRVQKIVVNVDEFLEWSRANGGKIDSNARAAFVAYKSMRNQTDH